MVLLKPNHPMTVTSGNGSRWPTVPDGWELGHSSDFPGSNHRAYSFMFVWPKIQIRFLLMGMGCGGLLKNHLFIDLIEKAKIQKERSLILLVHSPSG